MILASLKRVFAKKHKVPCPKSSSLLKTYHQMVKSAKIEKNEKLARLLKIHSVRSLSGVVSVSVLTKPWPCPGKCLYCPDDKNLPKSYLQGEPAVMRAIANKFNPYTQVQSRLKALAATGHAVSKIELIIIGGTWSFLPKKYQEWFVKECFRAANNHQKTGNLKDEQRSNETAKHRIIGITIETRPDFIDENEIKQLRRLGVTRVELGVQSVFDNVLKINHRGHGIKETVKATKLLKDAGFKICYHLMPNLPGSDLKLDEKCFDELFKNPDFRPDFLKIYPCVVVKEAPLYRLWQKGGYQPYSDRQLIELLAKIKLSVPKYCRIIRVYRDIPSNQIISGSKISNLRQEVAKELKKQGKKCLCIRCREIGQGKINDKPLLFYQEYQASGGKEIFLSFESKNQEKLFALLRLRLGNTAIIREVHTYGQAIDIGTKSQASPQHQGLGKKLIKEAERIAQKNNFKKIAVIAGIGSRAYYRKLGYFLKETYMVRNLEF